MSKKRISYFDNVKGVLIVLVVCGHLIEPLIKTYGYAFSAFDFIYLFHMPLFIFVSGLFCKSVCKGGVYRSGVVLYYLALCLLLYFFLRVEKSVFTGVFDLGNPFLLGNGSISWYLMAMAAYITCVPLFSRVKPWLAISLSVGISVFAGVYIPQSAVDVLTISRILVFLPFFLLGYYIDIPNISGLFDALRSRGILPWARLLSALILGAILVLFVSLDSDFLVLLKKLFTARNSYEELVTQSGIALPMYVMCFVRLIYYGAVCLVSVAVLLLVPWRAVPFLTGCGSRSLQVYFLHPFVYYVFNHIGLADLIVGSTSPLIAIFALFGLGVLLALALGYPSCIQRWFDAFKRAIERAAARSLPRAEASG